MNESSQNQVIDRLKKQPCRQPNCLSDHQDNVELIIFNSPKMQKTGLMCSACLIDSDLVKQLMPLQKYVLPIRKYMGLIVSFYQQYLLKKESPEWGPTMVGKEGKAVCKKIELFYNDGLKSALQLSQCAQSLSRKAIENLRKVYHDSDFQKIIQFLNEQNEIQQERMMISSQLTRISSRVRVVEGKTKYITEDGQRRQAQQILLEYRQKIGVVTHALRQLVEVHKQCLKGIIN